MRSGAYLEFWKAFNRLQRSQHSQYPQRLDSADVLSLAAPTLCEQTCAMTKSDRKTSAASVGFRFTLTDLTLLDTRMSVGGHSLMVLVSELTQNE